MAQEATMPTKKESGGKFTMLPDEIYNIIATLHEKSQALETYETYLKDAEDEESRAHIKKMIDLDQQCVSMCENELARLMKKHGEV